MMLFGKNDMFHHVEDVVFGLRAARRAGVGCGIAGLLLVTGLDKVNADGSRGGGSASTLLLVLLDEPLSRGGHHQLPTRPRDER